MNNEKRSCPSSPLLDNCLEHCKNTIPVINDFLFKIKSKLSDRLNTSNKISNAELEKDQYLAHGLAWVATYIESLNQMLNWSQTLQEKNSFEELEKLTLQICFGEYLSQLRGGIIMSQNEVIRPYDFGLNENDMRDFSKGSINFLIYNGNTDSARRMLVDILLDKVGAASFGNNGLESEYELIREQFFRYSTEKILPNAQTWHLKDELIPMHIIDELADLGVFGLTIPETFNGLGMDKTAMCIVSEELSRGYLGVGSLATRSDIAAELILANGTDAQKKLWLPKIASAEMLPTAVFTEPEIGSDLGSLRTRARLDNGKYFITGSKTWITHASRANAMTILARTNPATKNHIGLSMFIAKKKSGSKESPFPDKGIFGTEIKVIGYRGMKEFELGFNEFELDSSSLLGGIEGNGFKQLMETFESARIQTAARAIGVAQNALDLALGYSQVREQFGKKIVNYSRIYSKLALMAVELMVSRQLTYFSCKEKDDGRRCDLQAGMAKLLSSRVAWAAADNSLQIHGGNGFASDFSISRVLCDARILNIFEGSAEIQAQVIARRILENRNN